MYRALQSEFANLIPLGPASIGPVLKIGKYLDKISRVVFKRALSYRHNKFCARLFSRKFEKILSQNPCDVIFAPAGSVETAELDTDIPICYLSDTSFGQISQYYANYSSMWNWSFRMGNDVERSALQKAKRVVYPSLWASDYARDYYEVSPDKLKLIKLGANIEKSPESSELVQREFTDECVLLLLGVSWERKGGDIALEAMIKLRALGVNSKLIVCGCVPPVTHEHMEVIPFLNKSHPDDLKRFREIMNRAHFLVLPTRAEAYGVVMCEASAYGLPSIVTGTGGTTSVVTDGVNGFTIGPEERGEAYAEKIMELINSPSDYQNLCQSSRQEFEENLNWGAWAKKMRVVLEEMAEEKT